MDQGKLIEAIAELREAVRLKPEDDGAHYNLGRALYNQGRLDEAVAVLRTALRLKPDHAAAHNNLGNAYSTKGNYPRRSLSTKRRCAQPRRRTCPQQPWQRLARTREIIKSARPVPPVCALQAR